jgi:hypothetical protein
MATIVEELKAKLGFDVSSTEMAKLEKFEN